MTEKKVTITDIARACGVGLGTASRAINGKPGVKADVRRKVINYIEEIGWRSNSLRQRLQLTPEGKAVVFIAPTSVFEHRYNGELLRVLMETLPGKGYAPVVYYGQCRENLERAAVSDPYAVVIAGLNAYQAPLVDTLIKKGSRVIGLDEYGTAVCPSVSSDASAGAVRAVKHLLKAGHRSIGFLGGMGVRRRLRSTDEVNIPFVRQLLEGIGRALPEFSLKESAVSDCFSDLRPLRGQLARGRHSAWICSDTKMCRQFLYCAREMGIRIPEDISLTAFTPDVPGYSFEQDLTRFYPDTPRHADRILCLLAADPGVKPAPTLIRYRFHKGGTVAAPASQ